MHVVFSDRSIGGYSYLSPIHMENDQLATHGMSGIDMLPHILIHIHLLINFLFLLVQLLYHSRYRALMSLSRQIVSYLHLHAVQRYIYMPYFCKSYEKCFLWFVPLVCFSYAKATEYLTTLLYYNRCTKKRTVIKPPPKSKSIDVG